MLSFFRNALEPAALWGLMALLPVLVFALYFLKLRRELLEVPSTYLWTKSLEELQVNSLWQRLRRSLLLFLQLLLLLLVVLALLRPGWQGTQLTGTRLIFLIDNSASMSATDGPKGTTRLAAAQEQVARLIDQMGHGMSAMLISFADQARVEQEFTQNRRKLQEALAAIQPTSRPTNLLDALQLADGLANPGQVVETESNVAIDVGSEDETPLYLFSDGRFADVQGFSLGNLIPTYVPLGQPTTANLALTGFRCRRSETHPEEQQAFVQVTNFSLQPHTAVVELSLQGAFLDAQQVDLPAGESRGLTFQLSNVSPGNLTATLSRDTVSSTGDALALDNVAHAVLDNQAHGRVLLVTPGNQVLWTALTTERVRRLATVEEAAPATLATPDYQQLAEQGGYDLVIYDQCVPEQMPRGNTLFIGRLPPLADWQQAGRSDNSSPEGASATPKPRQVTQPQIIDWSREHPLLAYVELDNLYIAASKLVRPPRGGRSLIDAAAGPLFAIAPRDGFEDAVLGFEILLSNGVLRDGGPQQINTNWYNRHSFPTFVFNVVDYFVARSRPSSPSSYLPGEAVAVRTQSLAEQLTLTGPLGLRTPVPRLSDGSYLVRDTESPGLYEVREQDQVVSRFAVNLFDGQESNLAVAKQPRDGSEEQVAAALRIGHVEVTAQPTTPAREELWRPLLLAALLLLLAEWYIYHRRVYL